MNEVYKSDTLVVHDDREPLTTEQAIDILWAGKAIRICYPPDFSAEDESNIYDADYPIFINDIAAPGTWEQLSKTNCFKKIEDFLKGYELYK